MDYEKLYKAYDLQVYSYTISLAKNREIAEEIMVDMFPHTHHVENVVLLELRNED